jgi:hypothetical protein
MTIDKVIEAYIKLRLVKESTKKRHAEEMAPINDNMYKLSLYLQKTLQESGQTSAKTEAGTAFLQTDTTVAIRDWPGILAYIKAHDLWEMLEKRVSKSVVADYIDSTKEIPPGLEIKTEISCHIRKA